MGGLITQLSGIDWESENMLYLKIELKDSVDQGYGIADAILFNHGLPYHPGIVQHFWRIQYDLQIFSQDVGGYRFPVQYFSADEKLLQFSPPISLVKTMCDHQRRFSRLQRRVCGPGERSWRNGGIHAHGVLTAPCKHSGYLPLKKGCSSRTG